MDIRQLRTMLAIAETGSLTRAAQLLHVVQPALSRQLRQLEQELGAPLFERTRWGMRLTAPGRRFLDQVRPSLQGLYQAKAEFAASASGLSGTVAIGMLPSLALALSAALVMALRAKYPELRVRIVTGFTPALQEGLEHGKLDIAVLGDYRASDFLSMSPVLREPLNVIGLPQSALRGLAQLPLSQVAKMPLIVPAASQGLRHLIDRACTIIGVTLNIVAESDDTDIQLELVQHGVGLAILPTIAIAPAIAAGRLIAARVNTPQLHRTIVIGSPVIDRNPITSKALRAELVAQLRPFAAAVPGNPLQWLAQDLD